MEILRRPMGGAEWAAAAEDGIAVLLIDPAVPEQRVAGIEAEAARQLAGAGHADTVAHPVPRQRRRHVDSALAAGAVLLISAAASVTPPHLAAADALVDLPTVADVRQT